jgi:hypothetical protein
MTDLSRQELGLCGQYIASMMNDRIRESSPSASWHSKLSMSRHVRAGV